MAEAWFKASAPVVDETPEELETRPLCRPGGWSTIGYSALALFTFGMFAWVLANAD